MPTDTNEETSTSLPSVKSASVQDLLSHFKMLPDKDQTYFIDNLGPGALKNVFKAAKTEGEETAKKQLYPDIERFKQDLKAKEDAIKEYEAKLKAAQTPQDFETALNQRALEMQQTFTAQLEALASQVKASELSAAKEKALRAHNVPSDLESFVSGDSVEALQASALMATQTFNEMKNKWEAEYKTKLEVAAPPAAPPSATTLAPAAPVAPPAAPANPLEPRKLDSTFVTPGPNMADGNKQISDYTPQDIAKMSPSQFTQFNQAYTSARKNGTLVPHMPAALGG